MPGLWPGIAPRVKGDKVGYLVNYGVSGVEMYMIVSVSESDVVCYDGCKLYKMNLMANRTLRGTHKNSEGDTYNSERGDTRKSEEDT